MSDRAVYANADARRLPLADGSVHMIATSPPYWGLRDYGTATWEGGDAECDHVAKTIKPSGKSTLDRHGENGRSPYLDDAPGIRHQGQCPKCGAIRKDAQLGMEPLHDCLAWARGDEPCGGCYVCNMREWAREMWRVLRPDGTLWLNLGDSYASSGKAGPVSDRATWHGGGDYDVIPLGRAPTPPGLKPKDLAGIPWRVALALQADGWWLRSDIIWAKPNPMPESVTDRPTKAHEYVFLLTKGPRYFWDAEAVREANTPETQAYFEKYEAQKYTAKTERSGELGKYGMTRVGASSRAEVASRLNPAGRNIRTVWTIATAPYEGAHYAVFPPALVERMIRAGTSERGVCPEPGCGKPWARVVEKDGITKRQAMYTNGVSAYHEANGNGLNYKGGHTLPERTVTTVDWQPTCAHTDAAPVPAIVLDPFAGSGTTLLVARRLGRIGLGFDLSETYLRENCAVRLGHDKLAAWGNGIKDTADYSGLFRSAAL